MAIKDEPLLGIWIKKLEKLGCKEIVINTHYLAEQVNEYIKIRLNIKISIEYEEILLGTVKFIVKCNYFQNSECLMIHADNYKT